MNIITKRLSIAKKKKMLLYMYFIMCSKSLLFFSYRIILIVVVTNKSLKRENKTNKKKWVRSTYFTESCTLLLSMLSSNRFFESNSTRICYIYQKIVWRKKIHKSTGYIDNIIYNKTIINHDSHHSTVTSLSITQNI